MDQQRGRANGTPSVDQAHGFSLRALRAGAFAALVLAGSLALAACPSREVASTEPPPPEPFPVATDAPDDATPG